MIIRIKQRISKLRTYYMVYYDSGKTKIYDKLPKTAQEFIDTHKSNTVVYGTKVNPHTVTVWE